MDSCCTSPKNRTFAGQVSTQAGRSPCSTRWTQSVHFSVIFFAALNCGAPNGHAQMQ
jgi:hypothetical protein